MLNELRCKGIRIDRTIKNDPFKLYQGYIDIVKPIEVRSVIHEYENEIEDLKDQLNKSLDEALAIKDSCEHYL